MNDTFKRAQQFQKSTTFCQRALCVVRYDQPGTIALLQQQNYKFSLNVGIEVNRMIPAVGIIDTGAGPNLFRSELSPPKWSTRIKPRADPGFKAAERQKVNVQGVIRLHVKLGNLRVTLCFVVVTVLEISVLLRTTSIEKFS